MAAIGNIPPMTKNGPALCQRRAGPSCAGSGEVEVSDRAGARGCLFPMGAWTSVVSSHLETPGPVVLVCIRPTPAPVGQSVFRAVGSGVT